MALRRPSLLAAMPSPLDGMTDENGSGVYNIMVYAPRPILFGTFRLGVEAGEADTLLARLEAGLTGPLLREGATSSSAELAGGASRLSLLCSRQVLALCTNSPSTMVALRTRAVDRWQFNFAFEYAAHAANLAASGAGRGAVSALELRKSPIITVFFKRYPRARSLFRAVRKMLAGGGAEEGALHSYSRTRWAGEGGDHCVLGRQSSGPSAYPAGKHPLCGPHRCACAGNSRCQLHCGS